MIDCYPLLTSCASRSIIAEASRVNEVIIEAIRLDVYCRPSSNQTIIVTLATWSLEISGLAPKLIRLVPKGTNLGLFKISFSTYWLAEPKCTKLIFKSPRLIPLGANLTLFAAHLVIHAKSLILVTLWWHVCNPALSSRYIIIFPLTSLANSSLHNEVTANN